MYLRVCSVGFCCYVRTLLFIVNSSGMDFCVDDKGEYDTLTGLIRFCMFNTCRAAYLLLCLSYLHIKRIQFCSCISVITKTH